MAEVCAIVNSRPLTPLYEDPSEPPLNSAMILTHKTKHLPDSIPTIDPKDLYKSQRRFVQSLASEFWRKWKFEYMSTLQIPRKWTSEELILKEGDIVLLKEADTPRNHWPLARINKTFPSCDKTVRKVEICVFKDNTRVHYVRPIPCCFIT